MSTDTVPGGLTTTLTLATPGSVSGAIDGALDEDWYALTLSANLLYEFTLTSASIDGVLAVYDGQGILLSYVDNGLSAGWPEVLSYTPSTDGQYFIAVSGYGDATGSFQLEAAVSVPQTQDYVPGNTLTLESLSPPVSVPGTIDAESSTGGDDSDWYKVYLQAGQTYRIDLSTDIDLDGVLSVYQSGNATPLITADDGFWGDSEYLYFAPTNSGYYFAAVDGWGDSTGEFVLSVSQTAGNTTTDLVGQTTGTAGSIDLGANQQGHVDGAINSAADADWYAVDLAANTQYEIALESADLDGVLQLYGSAGDSLLYADNTWTGGSESLVFSTDSGGGTYFVGVSGYGDSTGPFDLKISASASGGEIDTVGDTYQTATSGLLSVDGEIVHGLVNSGVDEDVYSLALSANSSYLFDLSATTLDGALNLYGPNGEWLDSADYGGSGDTENLFFTPQQSGLYFIGVGGWSDSTGAYALAASLLTTSGGDIPGNTSSTENLLVPGFVDSRIDSTTDQDWLKVRMSEGKEYSFDLYSTDGELDGQLQILNASGTPVSDLIDEGWYPGDSEFLYFTAPTTADYFVKISGYNGSSGDYSIYASEAWDSQEIDWTSSSYDEVKWNTIDWWSWDLTTWDSNSDDIIWNEVEWTEITDYSAVEWAYVDWSEFDSSTYDELTIEQIDWDELLFADWESIQWDYIAASDIQWDELQYEFEFTDSANIDLTAPESAGNAKVFGTTAGDLALLGIGLDYFSGGSGDDYADGGEGADYLLGGDGDDVLQGGTGLDVMTGGAGNDTYYVDNAGDMVSEDVSPFGALVKAMELGSNIDTVISSIGYTLGASIENLTLANGNGRLNGVGNGLNNVLTGNESNNALTGGGGNDTLDGGAGIDVANFSGSRSNFSLNRVGESFVLTDGTGSEGTDTLTNMERLQFSDKKLALDLSPTGNTGMSLEFIGALAYPLIGDSSVVGSVLSVFDQNMSMRDVCQLAFQINLVQRLAGSSSDLDLAKLVYRNVVGNEASEEDAVWLASFMQGSGGTMSQVDFLTVVTQLELNQQHVNLVGLQQTGVEYI